MLSPVLTPGPMSMGAFPVSSSTALDMCAVTDGTTLEMTAPETSRNSAW